MSHLLLSPFDAAYMRRALAELAMLGVFGGIVGVHVMLRRLTFLTEVVQHTVFPGIAIAFAVGQSLIVGALVTGGLAVVLLTMGAARRRFDPDALMALLIATFFAIGVIVVSRRRGFQSDLTALLFGRILTVDQRQLLDTAVVAVIGLVVLAVLHKELVLRAFDATAAEALGYPVIRLDLVLNLVVTLVVVVAVRALGTVLVVAFIITPAATARLVARRVGTMMVIAATFSVVAGWLGLLISYHGSVDHGWRLASGATVVAVLTAGFVVAAVVRKSRFIVRNRAERNRAERNPVARNQLARNQVAGNGAVVSAETV